jgi:hypothetical protein
MRVSSLLPGLIGLAFAVTAAAQPPTTSTTTKFDGTYVIVSVTGLTQTFKHGTGQCPTATTATVSPFTITNGQVKGSNNFGSIQAEYEGFVNAQGQFTTRGTNPLTGTAIAGLGQINNDGTVHVRIIGWYCDWDQVWQRSSR